MEYDLRNPRFIREDHSIIEVEWNHPEFGWIPYSTVKNSGEPEAQAIWDQAMIQLPLPFDKPTKEEQEKIQAAFIREERDRLLRENVDPIVSNPLRWGDMSEADQYAYKVYRQALLDITDQPQFPTNVDWPILVLSTRS